LIFALPNGDSHLESDTKPPRTKGYSSQFGLDVLVGGSAEPDRVISAGHYSELPIEKLLLQQ